MNRKPKGEIPEARTKRHLHKKALYLSFFTVGYNFLEGLVSIIAGFYSGSIALVGFGFDSFIESISGGVIIWRFGRDHTISEDEEERIESRAVKLVAYSFFVLGIYILFESVKKLLFKEPSDPSLIGIIIAVVSIIVMPVLFWQKYKIGNHIRSRSLVADSKQTLACLYMSISLLVGLGLNYLFGFWWADPIAGLIIVILLIKEGYETLQEERLCSC